MSETTELNTAAWVLYKKTYKECTDGEKSEVRRFRREAEEQRVRWEREWR